MGCRVHLSVAPLFGLSLPPVPTFTAPPEPPGCHSGPPPYFGRGHACEALRSSWGHRWAWSHGGWRHGDTLAPLIADCLPLVLYGLVRGLLGALGVEKALKLLCRVHVRSVGGDRR